MGLSDEAAEAGAAHLAGAPQAVPEALVRAVCLPGDPAEARARLDAYRDAGADLPVVYPVAGGRRRGRIGRGHAPRGGAHDVAALTSGRLRGGRQRVY